MDEEQGDRIVAAISELAKEVARIADKLEDGDE